MKDMKGLPMATRTVRIAIWSEGSTSTSLNTNLFDTNTTFQTGSVTAVNTIAGSALFIGD